MRFEDYAREAARALSASGRSVDVPALSEMWARRRRAGVVLGSATIALVVAGTIGVIAGMGGMGANGEDVANGSESEVLVPAATVPAGGGGVLFGPPRIEKADTVEFPIALLDGTRLILTLPRSLADDVVGLVPGGAASWELDPCCARTLEVIYGSVKELYGDRQPDVEYEDADGNPVGFYTENDDLDYLVFQYGSWVVRAWDDDPGGTRFSEENREMFASLMRGRESSDGFLVLDPVTPMTIGPGDGPDATLTTDTREKGLVGVFNGRDCSTERPSTNPDFVTSTGNLVSFADESGMTSICWPDDSFYVWVARLDLSEAELEAIALDYATVPPVEETPSTTSTTTVSTTTSEPTTTSIVCLVTPTHPPVDTNPGWTQLAAAPIEGRIWHSTTWTGDELIVWGGVLPSTGSVHNDGAVFDRSDNAWHTMSDPPIAGRVGHVAVWTGDELIVWGGHEGGTGGRPSSRLQDGAAYDPDADTWRQIATPTLSGGPGYASVWTGSEMIVIGGNDGHLSFAENGLYEAGAYNPSTDTWRNLEMPINLVVADALWTGEEVVVYGIQGYLGPLLGAAYNPRSDQWRELPAAPIDPAVPDIEMFGDRILVWTYDPETDGIAALDLETLQWSELPAFPGQPSDGIPSAASMGASQTMVTTESVMAILSEGSDSWQTTPTPSEDLGPLNPTAWTGSEALFFSSGLPPGDPNAPNGISAWLFSYRPGD